MLNGFIALPSSARIACVLLLSICVSRFLNWAIYNWAYQKSNLGPWAKAPKKYPPHTWLDHLPAIGWLRLRRETPAHSNLYWLRPFLIEVIFPVACAWYYHFYISGGALSTRAAALAIQPDLHWQFLGHYILFTLMAIATFIDFDEFAIPDYITVPGTVIGIAGAVLAGSWLPMNAVIAGGGRVVGHEELLATSPMPAWLLGGNWGLSIGIAIIAGWALALLDRRWITRRGLKKAIVYFFVRIVRSRAVWISSIAAASIMIAIVVWAFSTANARLPYLMSSLLGLAFAGGLTWAVRISASWGLQVEALGFGDVTLMAMIGSFIGWQASLLVFFLAPMAAVVFAVLRLILTGDMQSPYGPYLCAAAVAVLVMWDSVWNGWAAPVFGLGQVILGIVFGCVILMGGMLWIWRQIKQLLGIDLY